MSSTSGTPATGTATGYDREDLQAFLTSYAAALGARDLGAVTDVIAFPALVVLDDRSLLVDDAGAVEDALRPHLDLLGSGDVVGAAAVLGDVDEVGPALLWAQVRWSYRDELAGEVDAEDVRYLLRRGRDAFEICAIVPLPG